MEAQTAGGGPSSTNLPPPTLEALASLFPQLEILRGIVHRDIKPENILIDKEGRVKIADFGIAKITGREARDFTLTGEGEVMGTPAYMAPEQVEHPSEVDHRADIYSLGVVFYQMLTGELPLGRFAPPSRKVRIDVRLDEVVLRTLEKEPGLRYQQAGEVKTRVETIAGTPRCATPCRNEDNIKFRGLDYWRVVWAIFTTAYLVAMITGWAIRFPLRREFFSKVTMEVKSDMGGPMQRARGLTGPTQQVVQHQILDRVIDNLKLCESWAEPGENISRDEAYRRLLKKLDIKAVSNTDLIEIGVSDADRREAADIANSIAVIYQQKRKENQKDLINQGLNKLGQEVLDQRKTVDDARAEAARIRNDKGIIDLNPEKDISDGHKETPEYTTAKYKYLNAKQILEVAETRLSTERMQIELSMVPGKIWEKAEPADAPRGSDFAPYAGLAKTLAIPGGLLVGIGILIFRKRRESIRGRTLALAGACLQAATPLAALATVLGMMHLVATHPGVSDASELMSDVGNIILLSVFGWGLGLVGLMGLIMLCIALVGYRYRAGWFFWFLVAYGVLVFFPSPFGLIFWVFFLMYCLIHRHEFFFAPEP
jgi:serine/threonine protein kinase